MRRIPHLLFGILALLASLVSPGLAIDEQNARRALSGLRGIYVLVEKIEPFAERMGLTKSTLQADVEAKLRQAGVRILTKDEWVAELGKPVLSLHVNAIPQSLGLYVFSIQLRLNQGVRLTRDPSIESMATTWSVVMVGTIGADQLVQVRDSVRGRVDEFIQAYLAVNPRR